MVNAQRTSFVLKSAIIDYLKYQLCPTLEGSPEWMPLSGFHVYHLRWARLVRATLQTTGRNEAANGSRVAAVHP